MIADTVAKCRPNVPQNPDDLTDAAGAYLLLISVNRLLKLPGRFVGQRLPPGRYGYAGSAYGPGGIRARCRRHLTRPATRRWHIDWLTGSADEIQAIAFPGDTECRLMKALLDRVQASCPLKGFGSSDCKRCQAHLVQLNPQLDPDDIMAALSATP